MEDQPVPVEEPQDESKSVDEVKGDVVNFSGQVKQITARTVNVESGGVGAVRSERVTINVKNGGVGAVLAQKAEATVQEGGLGALIARDVTLKGSNVSMMMAMNVSGDAKILFDMRAGLLAGVAAGLVITAFRILLGHRK